MKKEIAKNGKRQKISRRHHFHGRGFRPVDTPMSMKKAELCDLYQRKGMHG